MYVWVVGWMWMVVDGWSGECCEAERRCETRLTVFAKNHQKGDLSILCERFTTSKLQTFDDLASMATYGFRGEALASISHIAHLTVTTRTKDSEAAWRACYEAGRLAPPKPGQDAEPKRVAGRQGTQLTVEDLFYNVPTRRRAFRSASDEYNKIVDMLGRYAVHCGGVAFACKKHGESSASISVQASASTTDRIRHIYGGAVANELLAFATGDRRWGFRARGLASSANHSMKRTTLLLFINNRCVESANIRKALDDLYNAFLPKNGHPFVYLSLEIDPQRVDVNVHPTKREVNFLNEDEITRAVCEHVGSKLAEVDTSRTFSTQTLLPGGRLPASSPGSSNNNNNSPASAARPANAGSAVKKTPVRPYENNLVRTDSSLRKITSMFTPARPVAAVQSHPHPVPSGSVLAEEEAAEEAAEEADAADSSRAEGGHRQSRSAGAVTEYEVVEREASANWLKSVRELKEAVVQDSHDELTDIFRHCSFVGVVDDRRRLAAIQSGVKLYLVDYGRACLELFYQLGLNDFGNFGVVRFSPPLDLRQLLHMAFRLDGRTTSGEKEEAGVDHPDPDPDPDEAVDSVLAKLVERRQMLQEYFSLEVAPTGELLSIPMLIKGYMPPLTKLPQFLLRLGPSVRWNDEKGCFDSLLRELARFYVPEQLPNEDDDGEGEDDDDDDGGEVRARRAHVRHAVEHVFLPAFKAQLICTASLMQAGLVEVANLKGLYRVFERC